MYIPQTTLDYFMALAIPKRVVQWALNASLGSPFSEADSSESCTSTSSLQYIKSQLVAHGFVHDAGLSLDGIAKADADKVVTCLLGMLSQRIVTHVSLLSDEGDDIQNDLRTTCCAPKISARNSGRSPMHAVSHVNLCPFHAFRREPRSKAATKALQSCETHTSTPPQNCSEHGQRCTHSARHTGPRSRKIEKEKERMVER